MWVQRDAEIANRRYAECPPLGDKAIRPSNKRLPEPTRHGRRLGVESWWCLAKAGGWRCKGKAQATQFSHRAEHAELCSTLMQSGVSP